MKRLLLLTSILVASLILSGCGTAATPPVMESQPGAPSFSGGAQMEAVTAAPAATSAPDLPLPNDALKSAQAGGAATGSDATPNTQRLVVQTAELTIVVQDVKTRVSQLEQMANTMGGYVVSVNIGQTYAPDGTQVPDAQIVVRVPSAQLDAALDSGQARRGGCSKRDAYRSGYHQSIRGLAVAFDGERGRRRSIDEDHAERDQDPGCAGYVSAIAAGG